MEKGLSLVRGVDESILVFTADQQLFKIVVDVMFNEPRYFDCILPILGGMHMMMNFIHAIGIIMAGSGLKEILSSAFESVDKLLSGKMYPQNFRAFRMIAEELLCSVVKLEAVNTSYALIDYLDSLSIKSRTTKHWTDNFIKPVMIMMFFPC